MLSGIYQHKERKAVFVGDFIDRGTQNRRVIEVVRPMVEYGHAYAVMGNHEYNAICYHTPKSKTDWLRLHTKSKFRQHENFLQEYPLGQDDTKDVIEWFKTLPLFIEFDEFCVIHACWDEEKIQQAKKYLNDDNSLKENCIVESATEGTALFDIVERLLKGVEVRLPEPYSFQDKDGEDRRHIRVKWWGQAGASYRDLAFGYGDQAETFPVDQFPDSSDIPLYGKGRKPVFFGHYWMAGIPEPQQENVCCVDYSAGKGGTLVCYSLTNPDDCCQMDKDNFYWAGE